MGKDEDTSEKGKSESGAARLVRERTQSCSSILEFAKRKRGEPSPEGEEHAQKGKRKGEERDPRMKSDKKERVHSFLHKIKSCRVIETQKWKTFGTERASETS